MTQPSSIPHPVGRQRDGSHNPIHQTKIPINHRRSDPQDLAPLPGIPAPVFTEGMTGDGRAAGERMGNPRSGQ